MSILKGISSLMADARLLQCFSALWQPPSMYSHPLGVELHSLHLLPVPPSDREKEAFFRRKVSVLFARSDSNYKLFPGVDVWDIERDALNWPGGNPVIAHPPCRAWGQLRALANPRPGEKELALWAVEQVRRFGGVLEHPAKSTLWPVAGLPAPGQFDEYGGWTLPVYQYWWGHRAEKATFLYIVGCSPTEISDMPFALGEAPCICGASGRRTDGSRLHKGDLGWRPEITKAEREHTPLALCDWLVKLVSKFEISPKNTSEIALLNCSKNEQRKLAVLVPLQVSLRSETFSPKND